MAVDYARLRDQTMGSGLDEEAVTVNTRALIDKVLARYSGEWTTLRELIQNAADASATKVKIRFDTLPSSSIPTPQSTDPGAQLKHVLSHHTLRRLLVSNNGQAFGENDWSRLKRIAEGNPDETKIGAFGVGFYSVFADCESPFVTSGSQTMAFFWKGNSLFTRRGRIPQEQAGGDTTFLLDYRSTGSPVPSLLSLCQFLSTSLTFVGLESIELWIDDWDVLKLAKKSAPSASIQIPSDVNPKTKDGLMKITGVEYQNAQIDGTWMNAVAWNKKSQASSEGQSLEAAQPSQSLRSFFSRLTSTAAGKTAAARKAAEEEELTQQAVLNSLTSTSTATVFLRISTVNVQTFVSNQLSAELERATKKPPPKQTRIAILTSSYDETSASLTSASGIGASKASEIFASVLPSKNGRIFIGFPTAQTTGLLAHISAPSVIPTVERESIDLNARYVRSWNYEMLRVAGIACRVAYAGEMVNLKERLERQLSKSGNKKIAKSDIEAIIPAAIHTFRQYTFQESTPSSQVGNIIEEAFWTCSQKASIEMLSTRGVLPSASVRLASEDLSFVEGIPVVPDRIVEDASPFLNKLQEYGLLTEITTKDIKKELEAQAISEAQLIELLKWSAKKIDVQHLDPSAIQTLFDGTVVTLDESAKVYPSPVLLLGSITTFPNVSRIPPELPTPADTIPFKFVKGIPVNQLKSFGWIELQIVPWLRYLIEKDGATLSSEQSITSSAAFACQVLPVVSKAWESLSQSSQATVAELLRNRTIIPTKLGMYKPTQAYFSSVRLFDDLPTIHGLQGVKEKFLLAIGVRKTVELSVVFERLMSTAGGTQERKWSHVDLIKYLVSVRNDIPQDDFDKLRQTAICPAEAPGGEKSPGLYKVSDLFEPKDSLRELGLPLLYWPDKFRPVSPEASLLGLLHLKQYPSVPDLVNILISAAAVNDQKLYDRTLNYYLANWHLNNYRKYPILSIAKPFLPVQGRGITDLAAPSTCFTNKGCAVLDFNVLREDLQPHASILGVAPHPPILLACERLLSRPPKSRIEAKAVFGYFAGRLNEIDPNVAERLGPAIIVPIKFRSKDDGTTRMVSARSCFLGNSENYGDIFDFVDFGSEANSFLLRIGSKHEPSSIELAQMLARKPAQLLNTLGPEKYLALLRRLADSLNVLKANKVLWTDLKRSDCLIVVREVSSAPSGSTKVADEDDVDIDDETAVKEYLLANAASAILVDDFGSYRIFKDKLVTAPQEEVLEQLYSSLGAPWLSSIVENNQSMGPIMKDQSTADKLQKLIVERCRLFLHDHTADAIRHDARWIENTLQVKVTTSLTLRKVLRGYNATYTEKMTAALHRDTKKDATLYVTAKPDLFEVSRALMSLMLKRPKQQDFLALEMIMESDLRRLKTKGYNVDRILRQKAAEARLAENERQRQLQDEQNRIAEEEKAWKASQDVQKPSAGAVSVGAKESATPEKSRGMPGAFDTSPDTSNMPQRPKKGTFLSNISKQFGFGGPEGDKRRSTEESQHQAQAQSQAGGMIDAPPPYTDQDPKTVVAPGQAGVTPPHQLQQNLVSAIQASRAHNSSSLFNPPSTKNVIEQSSYCDNTPGHDLSFVADSRPGIKIFLSRSVSAPDRTAFLQQHSAALNAFAAMLLDVGQIFLLQPSTIHIYHQTSGTSIAFNSNGSLFCNLRYFLELHWSKFATGAGKKDAAVYWWVTLCHELAHNLVQEHGSQHEYFTESFVAEYFGKMVDKAARYGDGPSIA